MPSNSFTHYCVISVHYTSMSVIWNTHTLRVCFVLNFVNVLNAIHSVPNPHREFYFIRVDHQKFFIDQKGHWTKETALWLHCLKAYVACLVLQDVYAGCLVFTKVLFCPGSASDRAPVVLQMLYHSTLWGLTVPWFTLCGPMTWTNVMYWA